MKAAVSVIALAMSLAFSGAAMADAASAAKCADGLSANGKTLYSATAPRVKPDSKIADELRATARPLVMGGTLSRDDAKVAAEEAGKCLALLQK
ncbi:MAG TPA: hypothetical protein PKZ97_00255 [Azospirillaceae bacterium]|nr:hypothetical protein [Azospirillaceae bacterium]HRQ79529.1 hypothetical protein [Azospirillaceae bacterium]